MPKLNDQNLLLNWYSENRRDLPWRRDSDPYRVWISEVMLQQTTVQAVIPYYLNFLKEFPTVERLAESKVEKVLSLWSGLGYYSRARNLHKAAIEIVALGGFPKAHDELEKLPGFGAYTSRAVSSIAFGNQVGIVDGNVIRVLTRRFGLDIEWWSTQGRSVIQAKADELVALGFSSDTNQALMDLGATVCAPKSPRCLLCPWASRCEARLSGQIETYPKARPKKARQTWIWRPKVSLLRGRAGLIENNYAPFLKGHLIWPGEAKRSKRRPQKFDFRHSVTCHDIFVILDYEKMKVKSPQVKWIRLDQLKEAAPASLVHKAYRYSQKGQST
jgi:A/G-specific adenine glycosylase